MSLFVTCYNWKYYTVGGVPFLRDYSGAAAVAAAAAADISQLFYRTIPQLML
jgi:hypothetical protein